MYPRMFRPNQEWPFNLAINDLKYVLLQQASVHLLYSCPLPLKHSITNSISSMGQLTTSIRGRERVKTEEQTLMTYPYVITATREAVTQTASLVLLPGPLESQEFILRTVEESNSAVHPVLQWRSSSADSSVTSSSVQERWVIWTQRIKN